MKLSLLFFTILFAGNVFAELPSKAIDLDFYHADTGCLQNKLSADKSPAVIDAFSVYGRLKGNYAIPQRKIRYASGALGRDGLLYALRTGNAHYPLKNIDYTFKTGQSFAIEFWIYVYDIKKYFYGQILNIGTGYKEGLRFGFQRHKWSLNGWLDLVWGTPKGSEQYWHKGFLPEKWHQIVINYDAKAISLYIDGKKVTQKEAALNFNKGAKLLFGKRVYPKSAQPLDFKMDQLTIYTGALTTELVADLYQKRLPKKSFSLEDEQKVSRMKLAVTHDTYGYFKVGEQIAVLLDKNTGADELTVNGKSYFLPMSQKVSLSFEKPGMREVHLVLLKNGKVLKKVSYPVAIVPFSIHSSKLGAANIASRQPEITALGIKLSRVVVNWAEIEPEKQEYDWKKLDQIMKRSQELGLEVILCLTGLPKWMKRNQQAFNLPAEMKRYKKIWRLLLKRYDHVKYYEVWNAVVPPHCLLGSKQQKYNNYVSLLKTAATIIHKEKPTAKILAGRIDISDGIELASYLQKHASDYYDIFSAQKYSNDPTTTYKKSPWSSNIVKASTKPVWNTGCGVKQFGRATLLPAEKEDKFKHDWPAVVVDEWTGVSWQIQDLALQLADGIKRIILAFGPSQYYPEGNAATGLPGIKGMALATFDGLISKMTVLTRLKDVPAGLYAICFENPNGKNGLILFTAGEKVELSIAPNTPNAQVLNLIGVKQPLNAGKITVTEEPIYLLNVKKVQ